MVTSGLFLPAGPSSSRCTLLGWRTQGWAHCSFFNVHSNQSLDLGGFIFHGNISARAERSGVIIFGKKGGKEKGNQQHIIIIIIISVKSVKRSAREFQIGFFFSLFFITISEYPHSRSLPCFSSSFILPGQWFFGTDPPLPLLTERNIVNSYH
ncbi:hypothetical protein LZ30DRAFT_740526 [Colletotrichum cereale]|nr:hypothetical protein LZ30DRAFT_740526 [Colletotrichum cereale]